MNAFPRRRRSVGGAVHARWRPRRAAAFLGNLAYATTIPGGRGVVITTLRADFYHRLGDDPAIRTLAAANQVALGPMDAAGLRRAIEQPALRGGLELEPGLTRRILTNVGGRPGTLPLLEHLLYELWQRRSGRMLTLEAYGASGGVEGSLARRANAVYDGLTPDARRSPGGFSCGSPSPGRGRRTPGGAPPSVSSRPRRRSARGRGRRRGPRRGATAHDGP